MGKKALLILLMAFPIFLSAQCTAGDCINGSGSIDYSSGSKYVGQFKDGLRSGIGSLYYADGSKYQGSWKKDKMNGEGVETFPDGTTRYGIWENNRFIKAINQEDEQSEKGGEKQVGCISGNCKNGKGIYIYPSGAVYIGDFKNGEINGYGTCYYADGSKYQGNWLNRYPHGKGTKTSKDGSQRSGFWKRGQPVDQFGNFEDNSPDEFIFDDATNIQSGCISGNCQDGKGIYAYPDGSKYDGWFINNKPNGSGTFYYFNGDKYVGEFRVGQPHGGGSMFYINGNTLEGQWQDGEYLGNINSNRNQNNSCLSGNCINGQGTYIFDDGSKYTGSFQDGLPEGEGKVVYSNGEIYEGKMKGGSFEGFGVLNLANGVKVSGYWSQGVFLGAQNSQPGGLTGKLRTSKLQSEIQIWAVIIGVATYSHMPALRYTDDDAYRMYAFFKSPEGGALDDDHLKILVDEDATKKKIVATMEDVFGKAGPNDLVLLYFSGHGLRGSFLPIDFDGFNNKLFHSEVTHILEKSQAKLKLCIADACHSGSLLASRGGIIPETIENFYQNLAQASPGSALLLSSKSNETSLESSGLRQGVFSHFLIRGLKGESDLDNNKLITIQELYNFIYFNVRAYTGMKQSPIIKGNYDSDMVVSMKRK